MNAPTPAEGTHRPWDAAWSSAFETAAGDTALLAAGRALTGCLGPLGVSAGVVTAKLPAPDNVPKIRPRLTVPVLTDEEWDRVYAAVTQDPELVLSLRTERLTDALTDPARTGGVPVVPRPDEIGFSCNCPAGDALCAHTAAVGHAFADRLRATPPVLLSLRGRAHRHLKAHVRTLTSPGNGNGSGSTARTGTDTAACDEARDEADFTDGTLAATEAYARHPHDPGPPPPLPADLGTAAVAPALDTLRDEPPTPTPPLGALRALVEDAARRAAALLAGEGAPLPHDRLTDAVRLLAGPTGKPYTEAAAERLDLPPGRLRHLIAAHGYGGAAGVHVTAHRTPADPDTLAAAEAAIQPVRPAQLSTLERDHNRLTDPAASVQLRLGPDGRWHPFTDWLGTWRPAPGADPDPVAAYRAARRERARLPGGR
ncbi:hypothetical protein ACFP1Z_10300 [Streptomyces gamaensis]|uniref:SWIM-type domain-containing protein n=1 Tax=Streptomyces gamaensis TaxID=1763542 RepID=A0ABW0YVK9_9ACTN